jgi:hypothetical protein
MQVTVTSNFTGESWTGDVPGLDPATENCMAINERLFRFFNRVDQVDCDRLEDLGYTLPSMSVGDVVAYVFRPALGPAAFRVADMGFKRLRPAEAAEFVGVTA